MQFILKLLKEVLNRLSNIYKKEFVDELLSTKVSVDESEDVIEGLAEVRKREDKIIQDNIDSGKAYDEALSNVIKWQSYAAAMQSMVDDETAIQIAEEFEKAAEEYLKDPTVSKEWATKNDADGNFSTTNPYYYESPTAPIVDFSVKYAIGNTAYGVGCFNKQIDVPVFLPGAENISAIFGVLSTNPILFAPNAVKVTTAFANATAYDRPISFPKATNASYMLSGARSFNSNIYLPNATDCNYLLVNAVLFNKPLSLPKANNCQQLLRGSTAFNQPLSLPNATNCALLFYTASAFNQPLSLPKATNCLSLLYLATSFNSPLDIPNATDCGNLCQQATSFNQPVYLPKCKTAANAFLVTSMNAANIAATLNSLPVWTDGDLHVITFTRSPGIASTSTTETFTVTGEDGTEYSLENCPIFNTDDEAQTLRKAFVLAVVKKGWTVEL